MTLTFETATGVVGAANGTYDINLVREYAVGGTKPNGGYLLACLGRAALATAQEAGSPHAHVIAAGAQYLASPDLGPARVVTQVLRVGKTATQVAATVANGEAPGVNAQFTLGTLADHSTPFWGGVEAPTMPPIGECAASPMTATSRGITIAFDPEAGIKRGAEGLAVAGSGELRAWFQNDNAALDTIALLYAADALPPATAGVVRSGWVPTLDMTVYVRAIPAAGPISLRLRAQVIQDGFADEICEAWDTEGRLVLQSTQLAALRVPTTA